MDAFFKELGRTVLARWKRENFSLATFPEIARVALDERPPVAHVELPAFLREFLLNDEQAFQTQSGFGQPELVVYDHPRFYIQLLFWLDGTTSAAAALLLAFVLAPDALASAPRMPRSALSEFPPRGA